MGYETFDDEDRRLTILSILAGAAGYRESENFIRRVLDRVFAHRISVDRMRSDLAWLAEQGLVGLEQTPAGTLATLTARGLDASRGAVQVPGVRRPDPPSGTWGS
jgi:hypothetical protein